MSAISKKLEVQRNTWKNLKYDDGGHFSRFKKGREVKKVWNGKKIRKRRRQTLNDRG